MENYNQVLEAQGIAMDANGLATQRYQTYLEGAEAATNRFTAAWEKLATSITTSDVIIFFTNFGTAVLKLIDNVGILTIALSALATKALISGVVSQYTLAIQYLSKALLGATVSATALNVATGAIAFVAITAAIYGITQLIEKYDVSMTDLKKDFDDLSDATSDNLEELDNLASRYETLALKTEKSREDQLELIDIVSTLNTKYGMITDNVNLYTDAIDGNTESIYENINAIKAKKAEEAKNFYITEKTAYEESKNYLKDSQEWPVLRYEELIKSELWNAEKFNKWKGVYTATAKEMLQLYADMASQEGIEGGYWTTKYNRLLDNIDAAESLVSKYELFVDVLQEASEWQGVSSKKEGISNFWSDKAWSEGNRTSEVAIENNYNFADSIKAIGSEIQSALSLYKSYVDEQELSVDQILNIIANYDNYAELLTVTNGKIVLNTYALRAMTLAKIDENIASLESQKVEGQLNIELIKQIEILKALRTQVIADFNEISNARAQAEAEAAKAQADELNAKAAEIQEEAYQDLLQMTINMLRQKKQAEIDALQAKLDSYKAIIDAEKELIDAKEKEYQYDKEKEEKNEKIADIESELLELQFDDSEEGTARRLELEQQLEEAKEDLAETEHDRSIELQKDALDKEYERYEKHINKKIKALEDYLNESGTLTRDAIALLSTQSESLYQSLIEWNRQFGSGIDEDVVGAWQRAYNAMVAYAQAAQELGVGTGGGGNLGGGGSDQGDLTGQTIKLDNPSGTDVSVYASSNSSEPVETIQEGKRYKVKGYDEGAKAPYKINIADFGEDPTYVWVKSRNVLFEQYHEGLDKGAVGKSTNQYGEVFAKLLKGEYVVNPKQIKSYVTDIFPRTVDAIVKGNDISSGFQIDTFMKIDVKGNLDRTVIPDLEKISENAIKKVNTLIKKRGIFRNANNYSL